MQVHLIDGTYELFRHYYALDSATNERGLEVAATRGVLASMMALFRDGATHMAVATDHVIESFRNELWPGYKTGEGIDPALWAQFPLLEESLAALGVVVWPMVEYEADDGLAAGAALASADPRVNEVLICTPDKDLSQCVVGNRVIQFDRRQRLRIDEQGVVAKFGVRPQSIPDFLALVGDSADGFPGLKGWGKKSAATVLARYLHLDEIPPKASDWEVDVRSRDRLAETLQSNLDLAFLFRRIATVVREAPVSESVDDLYWQGPTEGFAYTARELGAESLSQEAARLADGR